VAILPRRGAHVTELTRTACEPVHADGRVVHPAGQCGCAKWRTEADLRPFLQIQQRLQRAHDQQDIKTFVADSFAVMRAAYPFANNPYLQETVENLQPAMSRAYYLRWTSARPT
jgi:DNA-binding GntR family transcriptional regulator